MRGPADGTLEADPRTADLTCRQVADREFGCVNGFPTGPRPHRRVEHSRGELRSFDGDLRRTGVHQMFYLANEEREVIVRGELQPHLARELIAVAAARDGELPRHFFAHHHGAAQTIRVGDLDNSVDALQRFRALLRVQLEARESVVEQMCVDVPVLERLDRKSVV